MNDNGNERALKEYSRPATKEDNIYYAIGYADDCDMIEECLAYHIERSDNTENEKEFITTFFYLVHMLTIRKDKEEEYVFFHDANAIDRVSNLIDRYEAYSERPLIIVRDIYDQYIVNKTKEKDLKSSIDAFAIFLNHSDKSCYRIISEFLGELLMQANERRKLETGNLEEMNAQLKLYEIVDSLTEKHTNWPYAEVRGNWKSNYVKPRLIDEWRTWLDHNSIETITKSLNRIIGQERAKYSIALFIRLHIERLLAREEGKDAKDVANFRNNCIMIGPSGSGKSMVLEEVKKIVPKSIPVVSLDTSGFTDPAYIGADVMTALSKIESNIQDQGKSIENAIIFCDEADKVLGAQNNVNSQTVRDQLLTLIQGDNVYRFEGGGKETRQVKISGETISYAFIGTFSKIGEGQRHGTCGFISHDTSQKINYWDALEKKCRISPEFLGRVSSIIVFSKPTKSDIIRYIKSPQSLLEIKTLANNLGLELSLTNGAIEELATRTSNSPRGMREIQNTLRGIMENYAFATKKEKVVISKGMVQEFFRY